MDGTCNQPTNPSQNRLCLSKAALWPGEAPWEMLCLIYRGLPKIQCLALSAAAAVCLLLPEWGMTSATVLWHPGDPRAAAAEPLLLPGLCSWEENGSWSGNHLDKRSASVCGTLCPLPMWDSPVWLHFLPLCFPSLCVKKINFRRLRGVFFWLNEGLSFSGNIWGKNT